MRTMEAISLVHKNRKLRQRRVKLDPLQDCSAPFSQIMLITFCFVCFPSWCYIYKEIKLYLFVTYMATQTADSWDNALNTAPGDFYSPSLAKSLFLIVFDIRYIWYCLNLYSSFPSNYHIMINYFKMTTFMTRCTFFQELNNSQSGWSILNSTQNLYLWWPELTKQLIVKWLRFVKYSTGSSGIFIGSHL